MKFNPRDVPKKFQKTLAQKKKKKKKKFKKKTINNVLPFERVRKKKTITIRKSVYSFVIILKKYNER
jgi:hypothetical protein